VPSETLFRGPDHALTDRAIGAFYFTYNDLGYGLQEPAYHRGLKVEFNFRGIPYRSEVSFSLFHRGVNIGDYRADLIVDSRVIVECKAVEKILPVHVAQVVTYLKATGLNTGLIFNFGPKPDVRRVNR
jgi:GxxExxY protein